jgi:hypothetical protein
MNSAYAPKSQQRIPTRVCQGRIVTTDLPTLGTNPNSKQYGSTTQEANDLGNLRCLGDRPHGPGGPSAGSRRTVRKYLQNHQYCTSKNEPSVPYQWTVRASQTVLLPRADCPTNHFQPKPPDSTDQNKATQELTKNTTNTGLISTSRTVHMMAVDCPPGSQTAA